MWSHFTWVAQRKYTHSVIRKYWVWEIKNICWVYFEHTEYIQYIVSSFDIYPVYSVYSKCTQHVFLISQTQYFLITLWVYFLWATQVKCDHMTQYILNVTTKGWLKHLLATFFEKFKKYWVYADGAHCGHMIQYFLNILTAYWAGKLQIHCSVYSERTRHVLVQKSAGILDMEPPCT